VNILHDEKGAVLTAVFLILFVVFFAGTILAVEVPRTVLLADLELKHAVETATRDSAMMLNSTSIEEGHPCIIADDAHGTFRAVLAKNLSLSEYDLWPLSGSLIKEQVDYLLIVYNGPNPYGEDEIAVYSSISGANFPDVTRLGNRFTIKTEKGNRTFELDSPGCIGVVKCEERSLILQNGAKPARYAVSKVESKVDGDGNFVDWYVRLLAKKN